MTTTTEQPTTTAEAAAEDRDNAVSSSSSKNADKKTGIDFFDNLDVETRKLAIRNAKAFWRSLTKEEKIERLDEWYGYVRQKMHERAGTITEREIINELLEEFPRVQKEAAEEMWQAGFFDIARDIMQRRWFVDTWGLDIVDCDD
jgi:hypothetical protein